MSQIDYFGSYLKSMSDLDSSKAKNEVAQAHLRELEARVAELEEREKHWQEERKELLRQLEGEDEE